MHRRLIIGLVILAALAVGLGLLAPRAVASHRVAAGWVKAPVATAQQPAVEQTELPHLVTTDFAGDFLGWAMLDRATGSMVGSNLDETSSTESMIKSWLVADFLRRQAAAGQAPDADDLVQAREAIRWSDDDAAQVFYEASGEDDSVNRMIRMCELEDSIVYPGWWSRTQMSPRDAVQLGECLADGTAAGPVWTDWLLDQMRQVEGSTAPDDQEKTRGGGRWGIIDAVPVTQSDSVAIKNGWTSIKSDGNWHVSCLAITDDWIMSVMMRYPSENGLDYGADTCQEVARQLLA